MTQPTDPVIQPEDPSRPPLWMPAGSVRALMALGIVGSVFGRIAFGLDVSDAAMAAAVAVTTAYGVMRVMGQ